MKDLRYKIFTPFDKATSIQIENMVEFLHLSLRSYPVKKKAIRHAIEYAFKEVPGLGGFIITVHHKQQLVGVSIINKTGMKDYFPEEVLAYLVIHQDYRKRGIGRQLLTHTLRLCKGEVGINPNAKSSAKAFLQRFGLSGKDMDMITFSGNQISKF